ncbi:MAG: amidohydrolase family protein, partial [Eubacteriales bacterium]|nr:amidohydrolase family protein [Eubacteriales bacterium]
MAGLPWQTAINSCTINPARLIGVEASKGSITAGKDADVVVLGDDYSVEAVYVCGQEWNRSGYAVKKEKEYDYCRGN